MYIFSRHPSARPCTRVFCATMKGAARKCVRESKIFRSPFANVNYSSACKLSRARLHKHQTPGRAVDQQWTLVCVRHRYPSSQKHALPQCASSGLQLHECHSKVLAISREIKCCGDRSVTLQMRDTFSCLPNGCTTIQKCPKVGTSSAIARKDSRSSLSSTDIAAIFSPPT